MAPRILDTYRRFIMSQFEKLPSGHIHALVEHLKSSGEFSVVAGLLGGAHLIILSGCWPLCCHPSDLSGTGRLMCWRWRIRECLFVHLKPVSPKGNQPWIFIGRANAEAEAPILCLPAVKSWLIGKDSDPGKDWGQKEKWVAEDEMVGWHHRLNGHEFEQTLGVVKDREALHAAVHWVSKSRTRLSDWPATIYPHIYIFNYLGGIVLHPYLSGTNWDPSKEILQGKNVLLFIKNWNKMWTHLIARFLERKYTSQM